MQLVCLALATAITLLALITHMTIGTAQNASPILKNTTLPEDPRNTLMFSWKANSVLMLFMTVSFASDFFVETNLLVLYNALLAGVLAATAAFVAIQAGANPLKFPPMPLFTSIAMLGISSYVLSAGF
ncbi:hypothetical protein [Labrenzia sp. CE80]|uniref:hypothetical protein n=1 Tax=Labrenzia sp. CE80 TaxID=1788986 RepID=UPI00129A78B3|nr:hypothetical protein [Labrenzia sp. CE80]